jgi:hypothetical protein
MCSVASNLSYLKPALSKTLLSTTVYVLRASVCGLKFVKRTKQRYTSVTTFFYSLELRVTTALTSPRHR